MSFNDIFKSSFLENMTGVSLLDMAIALVLSFLVGIMLLVMVNKKPHLNPYIVVVRCDGSASEQAVVDLLGQRCQKVVTKSKTARAGSVELNLEVRLKDDNTEFVNELAAIQGVADAALVSYNGDYLG